jgi:tRNA A-37 threonylcarbamoyl transferase component Bud32
LCITDGFESYSLASTRGYAARVMVSDEGCSIASDPLVGRVLDERYRICRTIGRGGMGVVYEAQHLHIGRKVAIKTMAAHSFSDAAVERFRREARAPASVGSSHIVDVLDMGQLDAGSLYIVLEHLDGVDLGFAVASERRMAPRRGIAIVSQLCDALSAVHAAGIVHRDLKPENIFLISRDGQRDFVKVLDFGVCKFQPPDEARLTASGDRVGTPQFMAPEQIEGRREIDHRTDIFALGAILHFVLTGRPPFDAESLPKLFLKICNDPTPSARAFEPLLPVELDSIIRKALQKEPLDRFSSCLELKNALAALAEGPPQGIGKKSCEAFDTVPDGAPTRATGALVASLRLQPTRRASVVLAGLAAVGVTTGALAFWARSPASGAAVEVIPSSRPAPSFTTARSQPTPAVAPVVPIVQGAAANSQVNNGPSIRLPPARPRKGSVVQESVPDPVLTIPLPDASANAVGSTEAVNPDNNKTGEPSANGAGSLPLNRNVKRGL